MTLITDQKAFNKFCDHIEASGIVGFDTEFVAESYYRPRLCLLQFATPDETACVDPFKVHDLSPWWKLMVDDATTVIIHGGREEIRFCQFATQDRPRKLVDVQIAEGLCSRGFPISYTNLVNRVAKKKIQHGKETRTDWEKRPLTDRQIQYGMEDVQYLIPIWNKQQITLTRHARTDWAYVEFERFIDLVLAEEDRDGWLRLPGYSKLNRREMFLVQKLYEWRRKVAERSDKPQRRIFRDDMLMEVAKRQPKSVAELNMTRGMNRRDYQTFADDLIKIVSDVSQVQDGDLPPKLTCPQYPAQDEVLARILGLALANRCQELGLSMSLVGTSNDLKELVRWHVFDCRQGEVPKLQQGWRREVCGQLLTDVLDGKVSLRVSDPKSENPLRFDVE